MQVIVASHEAAIWHDTGPRHPERPERVAAVRRGITRSGLEVIDIEAPRIATDQLALVHDPSYIEMVETFCSLGGGALDMDTVASEDSWEAALRAAGGVIAVIEELESRSDATGFAMTRPPGHHALPARAMGFCLFNNVAVAAALLRSRGERVTILDWDVHHGNGTQEIVGPDPGIVYVSIHQSPFYPFHGWVTDIDMGAPGTVLNVPVPAGTAGDVYRRAWSELVLPVLEQFDPGWVLISAGFDAHARDMLADLRLESSDYGWMAQELSKLHPANRTVVSLEGGYDLDALEQSSSATLRGLAGEAPPHRPATTSPPGSEHALAEAASAVSRHWRL